MSWRPLLCPHPRQRIATSLAGACFDGSRALFPCDSAERHRYTWHVESIDGAVSHDSTQFLTDALRVLGWVREAEGDGYLVLAYDGAAVAFWTAQAIERTALEEHGSAAVAWLLGSVLTGDPESDEGVAS